MKHNLNVRVNKVTPWYNLRAETKPWFLAITYSVWFVSIYYPCHIPLSPPQVLVKVILLLLVPIPYYVRLFIYFKFEAQELKERDAAIHANGLTKIFNIYRTNIIQYFSPIHGVFIATYIFYFLSGLVLGFADQAFR